MPTFLRTRSRSTIFEKGAPMSPILSSRAVRVVLLVLGLATLIGLVVHIGPDRIYRAGASLGAVGVAVMLLPSTVMYLLDCLGWRFT
jgi:small-conductance mechanosensitive channel